MLKESSDDHFDVIVIGAGAGGLGSAALLAKAGKKVLLVEREVRTGGYISPLESGPYQFDIGPRLLMGCNRDGPFGPGAIYELLDLLDATDRCEFIPTQPFVSIRLPGLTIPMWSGQSAFVEGLRKVFPTGLENLKQLLDLGNRLYQSGKAVALAKRPWGLLKIPTLLPEIYRYRNATLEDVLITTIPDLRARVAVEALWSYLGLEPQRASFLMWAVMMAAYIEEGAFFCKGGLHSLADAIADSYIRLGGELLLDCEVTKILVENRAVAGVRLAGGREVFAPIIVSTIDPRYVFGGMIDAHQLPVSYYKKLKSFKTSVTGINISLLTDLNLPALGFGFETLIYDSWDRDQFQRNPTNGQVGMFTLTVSTIADPSLAPPGCHMVSAFCALPEDVRLSSQDRSRYGAVLFAELKKHIPRLSDHLMFAPDDVHPHGYLTHDFVGPIYGWTLSPQQSGFSRLGQYPPIKGLYLAGQWTQPGPGVMSVILSGMAVVKAILT